MTGRNRESGVAMITALAALLLVTVLGVSITTLGMMSVTVAGNDRESNEALAIADAGMTHAKALLLNQVWVTPPGSSGYSVLLTLGDGTSCNGDEFSVVPTFASSPYPPADQLIPVAGRPYPVGNTFGGRYLLRLCDDHSVESTTLGLASFPGATDPNVDENRALLVRSRGMGRNGAEATIEALFNDRPLPGLLVDGNLRLNGSPRIEGDAGGVHANGNLDLSGVNVCVQQFYGSVGAVTGTGNAGGCPFGPVPVYAGSDPYPVPKLDPLDYQPVSDYRLVNGAVRCGPANTVDHSCIVNQPIYNPATGIYKDVEVRNAAGALVNTGFAWNNGQNAWVASGAIKEGTYFTDMNISVTGSPGTVAAPVPLTFFARGWVDIGGTPSIKPDNLGGSLVYAIVAGTDLRITGDVGVNTYEGLYYARDQINFQGNPEIAGLVVSGNVADCGWPQLGNCTQNNLVMRDSNGYVAVGGNPRITYAGNAGWNALRIASWRECRGADPENPCGNP